MLYTGYMIICLCHRRGPYLIQSSSRRKSLLKKLFHIHSSTSQSWTQTQSRLPLRTALKMKTSLIYY